MARSPATFAVTLFPAEPGMILSLDVSSMRTGFAVFGSHGLHAFGAIKPSARLESVTRIDMTVDEVLSIVRSFWPRLVVMEWTKGKMHHKATEDREPTGLAVMGQAQGAVRQAIRSLPVIPSNRPGVVTFDE